MKKIRVYKTEQGYMAQYFGSTAKQMIELFGSDTLPTAFASKMDSSIVYRTMLELNPRHDIQMEL